MIKKYPSVALLLTGSLICSAAHAQDMAAKVQEKVMAADGTPELVAFRAESAPYTLNDARKAFVEQLQLTNDDQMLRAKTETDQLGFVHEKYQQYFKGIKVEHATYSLHARAGKVETMTGKIEHIRGLSVTPTVNAASALQSALRFVGASKYMWQDAREEAGLKQQEKDPGATYLPKGELVIVENQTSGKSALAWKFNVYAQLPISRAYIYVDAHTGQVVAQDAIIKHVGATGTFATAYSGSRSFTDGTTTGGYFLREGATRGLGIETYNCKKGNSYTAATDFIDADNSWTEYNNANFDNVAGDAHIGAQATYDYWKNIHGRNSYDNAGAKIKSYVHFDDTPTTAVGYENAYWNGSVMTYGDGATRFRPLTSLDVCGHEIGHAVCEKTANLTYANESGAMNEGLSDIWGAAIEAYAVNTLGFTSGGVKAKSTWLIGEEIDKQQAALRSMSDPKSLGQPAYYKGQYWVPTTTAPSNANDQGGVHTNSGVLNHWFYILTVGKAGTNEGGGVYSVTGVGIDAAAKITYRMESVYMVASSTYAQARSYSIQAATDLYGAGSAQVIAVTNAWFAVGVGAAYGGTTPPPTTVTYCTSKGTSVAYEFIDYVKLGTLARTSGADGGYYNGTALAAPSIGAGTSQTVSFSAGYAGTAYTEYWKVYIDYNQNGLFTDAGELVVSGSSASTTTLSGTFTVPTTAKSGNTRMRVVMSDASATTSCNAYSYGETEDYTVNITGGAALTGGALAGNASLTNGTPIGNEQAKVLEVYPNPATDVLRLSLPGNAEAVAVQVLDVRGAAMAGARYEGNGQLNIAGLAKGMYTLTVSDGQKVFHQRFIKQ
ncbi:Por secretion system C-terminal sorting domain-containing protein [Hymenobacter daecheongensis DSM 21074]|uniref:Por secretion system C-terminal sorting domain-containing protein n=1 Tax=Hymenobacter daecheongensis DSM 21074 TaxID=1121955 RepID=A0A1M6AKP0_9BACT|nr:M4 family metallopeptidase [Hymenobacter daecheongensis]SHI36783.1 Por secretion system C-terminal sorting domain-containing protein [Hymenobacter daecheongensis DSM 21074]